jgi:hypothetical protein
VSVMTKLPFGKYKGQSVADIALVDAGYLTWLSAQPEMRDRFPSVFEAIDALNGGADCTPVHNKIQAAFLDEDFRKNAVSTIMQESVEHQYTIDSVDIYKFEHFCDCTLLVRGDGVRHNHSSMFIAVEIKPTVGDEYPQIMRQMAAQHKLAHMRVRGQPWGQDWGLHVLYTRDNVSNMPDQILKEMFAVNKITLVIDRSTPIP